MNATDTKAQKVVVSSEKEVSKPQTIKNELVKSIVPKKVLHTSTKVEEKKTQKLKPHHLYVKSDAQLKQEFKKRREEHKKFRLREEQRQKYL